MAEYVFYGAADGQKPAVASCGAVEFESEPHDFAIQTPWGDKARQAGSASG
jgi:hypothetical protein